MAISAYSLQVLYFILSVLCSVRLEPILVLSCSTLSLSSLYPNNKYIHYSKTTVFITDLQERKIEKEANYHHY